MDTPETMSNVGTCGPLKLTYKINHHTLQRIYVEMWQEGTGHILEIIILHCQNIPQKSCKITLWATFVEYKYLYLEYVCYYPIVFHL